MNDFAYAIIWIVLLVFPLITFFKRYWIASTMYSIGCLIFLWSTLRDNGGWDDLADFATLLVVIAPIYLVGTVVWAFYFYKRKRK